MYAFLEFPNIFRNHEQLVNNLNIFGEMKINLKRKNEKENKKETEEGKKKRKKTRNRKKNDEKQKKRVEENKNRFRECLEASKTGLVVPTLFV